jgi:hypothetical protein
MKSASGKTPDLWILVHVQEWPIQAGHTAERRTKKKATSERVDDVEMHNTESTCQP